MKPLFVVTAIILFSMTFTLQAREVPKVVTSVEGLHSIVEAIGGDSVSSLTIAKGTQDPHYLQAKPSYMVKVSRADILFSVGLELEIGWLPLIVRGARNPSLQHIDVSESIPKILGVPKEAVSRADGDIHSLGNPHYLLNPSNGFPIAETIREAFASQSPGNKLVYESNFKSWSNKLRSNLGHWERQLRPLKGERVIDYHSTFEYLRDWLGFEIANYVEPKPGVPTTQKHLRRLVEQINSEKIELLICPRRYYNKRVRFLEKKTDIRVVVLPEDVNDGPGTGDYIALFGRIAELLERTIPQDNSNGQ